MINNFDDIQNIWQNIKSETGELDELTAELKRLERKSKRERVAVLTLFPLTIVALIVLLPFLTNVYYLVAILMASAGMLMILFQMYLSKIKLNKKESNLSNKEYVDSIIKALHRKMRITSKYIWFYTFLLIAGINIGYVDAIGEMNLTIRIMVHFILSTLLGWFMYSAIRKRNENNKREILPLIKKLELIQKEFANA
jgi:membrane protein implicated in regulation of membrane protease activity